MCVQNVSTEQDCLYLNYLNNCVADRIYPPLRMYKNENFLIVDGADSKQISAELFEFEMVINGETYLNVEEAQRQLAIEIQCVNNSRTGDAVTQLNKIVEQLSQRETLAYIDLNNNTAGGFPVNPDIENLFPFTVATITWQKSNLDVPVNVNFAPEQTVNNMQELADLWNANIAENQLTVRDSTSLYINEGTEPVPVDGSANISFILNSFGAYLFFVKQTNWGEEQDAPDSSVNGIEKKICEFVDGQDMSVSRVPKAAYSPGVPNNAILIDPIDVNRELIIVSVYGNKAWLRLQADNSAPSLRDRDFLLQDGDSFAVGVLENGRNYYGAISLINFADGEALDYSIVKFSKV